MPILGDDLGLTYSKQYALRHLSSSYPERGEAGDRTVAGARATGPPLPGTLPMYATTILLKFLSTKWDGQGTPQGNGTTTNRR